MKSENYLRDLGDTNEHINICITEVPEEEINKGTMFIQRNND